MQWIREAVALWSEHRAYRLYLLLLLLALIKQWFFPTLLIDSVEYVNASQNLLLRGFPEACTSDETCQLLLQETRRTPGYPLLLLAGVPMILLLQTVLAASLPLIMVRIAASMGMAVQGIRIMLWLLAAYPLQYFYATLVMPEIWVQWLILVAVCCWVSGKKTLIPVCLSALLLLKPVFLPAGIAALLLFFVLNGRRKLLAALPLLTVLLVSDWNRKHTGSFHYTSVGAVNAYEYNIRPLIRHAGLNTDSFYLAGDSAMKGMSYAERYGFLKTTASEWVLRRPFRYAWLHARGGMLALLDPGRYDLIAFSGMQSGPGFMDIRGSGGWKAIIQQPLPVLIYLLVFGSLALFRALAGFYGFLSDIRSTMPLWLPVIYILLLTGPVGSARYLLPVAPLLMLAAGLGYAGWMKRVLLKRNNSNTIMSGSDAQFAG